MGWESGKRRPQWLRLLRPQDEAPISVYRRTLLAVQEGDLHDPAARPLIQRALTAVVETEGPILLSVAARRIGNAFGLKRVTLQTVEFIGSFVDVCPVLGQWTSSGERVLWPAGVDPMSWSNFRVPEYASVGRPVGDIPLLELKNAVMDILVRRIRVAEPELVRDAARLFGVGRTGRVVRERLTLAVDAVVASGGARRDGEMVVVAG